MLISIGTCILGLSSSGSLKNPVTRPVKSVLHQTLVITLDNAGVPVSWTVNGTAHCSPGGLSTNRGGGTYNLDGSPNGTGVTTVANGDQFFWSSPDGVTSFITGGTGRFKGATGTLKGATTELVWLPDPPPGTLVADMTGANEGTITY